MRIGAVSCAPAVCLQVPTRAPRGGRACSVLEEDSKPAQGQTAPGGSSLGRDCSRGSEPALRPPAPPRRPFSLGPARVVPSLPAAAGPLLPTASRAHSLLSLGQSRSCPPTVLSTHGASALPGVTWPQAPPEPACGTDQRTSSQGAASGTGDRREDTGLPCRPEPRGLWGCTTHTQASPADTLLSRLAPRYSPVLVHL